MGKYFGRVDILLNNKADVERLERMLPCLKSSYDGGDTLESVMNVVGGTYPATYADANNMFLGNLACLFLENTSEMEDIMQEVEDTFISFADLSTVGTSNSIIITYSGKKCFDFFHLLKEKSKVIQKITISTP